MLKSKLTMMPMTKDSFEGGKSKFHGTVPAQVSNKDKAER
jgi:hypothetical protein